MAAKILFYEQIIFPLEFGNFRNLVKILAEVSSLELLVLLFQDKRTNSQTITEIPLNYE